MNGIIYVDKIYPTMKYKGYEWNCDSELSLQLGKDEDYVLRARRATVWEFGDYVNFIDRFLKIKDNIDFANSLISKDRSNNKNIEAKKSFLLDFIGNYRGMNHQEYYIFNTMDSSSLSELNRMYLADKTKDHKYFLKFIDYLLCKYSDNISLSLDNIELDMFHEIIKKCYTSFFIICKEYFLDQETNELKQNKKINYPVLLKFDIENCIYNKICPKEIMDLYYILDKFIISKTPYFDISVYIYKKFGNISIDKFNKEMIEIDNMFDQVNEYLRYIDLIDFSELHDILSFSKRFKSWREKITSSGYSNFLNRYDDPNKRVYNYIYAGTPKYYSDMASIRITSFINSGEYIISDFYKDKFPKEKSSDDLSIVYGSYPELYSEYNEYILNNSIRRIKEFVDSKYKTVSKFYSIKYPKFEYYKDLKIVNEKDTELYSAYKKKIESAQKARFIRMVRCTKKAKKAIIDTNYTLSFLDFLKIYNLYTAENLKRYYDNIAKKFDTDTTRVLRRYLSKIDMKEYNINNLFKEKITVKGIELKEDDKKKILSYISKNNLPKIRRVYSELYKLYLSGNIDLDIPFKSLTKETVK